MNRNLIIVLVGGFLIAVLVAFVVQAGLNGGGSNEQVAAVEEVPTVDVLVADKVLAVGDPLVARWQKWPEEAVFHGAIIREGKMAAADAASGRLLRSVVGGEPITQDMLISEDGGFIPATLGEGMRAVAIQVSAGTTAGGFVGPGDYVDIILTYREMVSYDGPENQMIEDYIALNLDRLATETILQNVRVLAVDQTATRDGENAGPKVGRTITVEVTPQGAEVLAAAQGVGELSLALRRLGDESHYVRKDPIVTDKRITGISDEIYRAMTAIQKSSGQNANIVRIYNGFELDEVPVRQ